MFYCPKYTKVYNECNYQGHVRSGGAGDRLETDDGPLVDIMMKCIAMGQCTLCLELIAFWNSLLKNISRPK